ncbi:hypothetical protein AMS68_003102 [Peltaster fructicola]|uniref:Transcription factor domain-containing protein n=1 Tax=Peltaster fructicola TaxID=286661 RepID=A0A6H0XSG9_9PEZI|nr:hypothetical protein AMS68_003102 [Peltaster fructicola]
MNGQTSQSGRSKLEHWPGLAMSTEDWVRKGRENYDVAVSLLRQSLAGASRPRSSALPIDSTPQTVSTAQGAPLPSTDSDELVAATAILCVYEFLDASGMEWSRHLDGAKSLFDVAKDGMVPLTLPPSPISIAKQVELGSETDARRPSQGRIAVFWNFARQDMLAAFINSTRTRLDTNDLPMWQSAGLRLTFDGKVCPSAPQHLNYTQDYAMSDDMICNALIWLMSKLVNFIASSDGIFEAISPLGMDFRHQALIDEWNDLEEQFRVWYDGLPDSFQPSVVRESEEGVGIGETWFPRSMCASTMQSYHFARIQLLHHKPPSITKGQRQLGSAGLSLAARHTEYSTILQQTRAHAKEIVSIGLGRADEGARVHAVQPLWTAGLVLGGDINNDGQASPEADMWRCTIVALLRAIERDMGWAAEYRIQSLLELWGLPHDWDPESDFALG